MNKITNLIAGLAGAVALNLLHESLKNKKNMPRIDKLGEQALEKSLNYLGTSINNKKELYLATLAGDIAGNTLYYSLIGGKSGLIWPKALALGLSAGIGAVTLPSSMGLNNRYTANGKKVIGLTMAYYLCGALVSATVLKLASREN